ncbi:TSUP family transporter [Sphingomonas glaciei]|uniref:Probable membrane transporter protein n=1 Tax=Sphingomonas glaciei TaxID=2938948 RepID=A0ABY5MXE4_9SPHN|nr:TSUP family transporter [Sphingomonas glaciei]UUR08797.1 TSUP family transporter [Sphingomonas glaciei]
MIDLWLYPVLTGVALAAGFIDAIAGGGGLIMMPALLVSGVPPLHALGTNKLQSMCGTFVAMRNYGAKGLIDWRLNLPTALIVFAGSASGALLVQYIDARTLALVIPLLLLANAVYILLSPRMGDEDAHQRLSATGYAPIGGAIGLYDGFFGPGTGSFFTSTLVALRGYGLTRATALCKYFNWTSNVAAVLLFAVGGQVLWLLGLSMAVGAMAGGWLGSHTAMRYGAKLIRPLLVTASVAMTARLLWGYFSGG